MLFYILLRETRTHFFVRFEMCLLAFFPAVSNTVALEALLQ
jgi:hypothetical protein